MTLLPQVCSSDLSVRSSQLTPAYIGGSATAAGSLVEKLGGKLLGYIFLLELDFLRGRDKLNAPVFTLLSSQ